MVFKRLQSAGRAGAAKALLSCRTPTSTVANSTTWTVTAGTLRGGRPRRTSPKRGVPVCLRLGKFVKLLSHSREHVRHLELRRLQPHGFFRLHGLSQISKDSRMFQVTRKASSSSWRSSLPRCRAFGRGRNRFRMLRHVMSLQRCRTASIVTKT